MPPALSSLAHTITGQGPTLVLIHGLAHRQHAWDSVVEEIAEHRRVVTVDLPGHGASPGLPSHRGIGDWAPWLVDQVETFVRQVTPPGEKAHVAGNSLGGYIALELAARGEVASATALSPAGFFRGAWDQRRTLITFRVLRATARACHPIAPAMMGTTLGRTLGGALFYAKPWRTPAAAALLDVREIVRNTAIDAAQSATAQFTPVDPSTAVPVSVIWGRRDLILPVYQASLVHHVFPHARVSTHPGLGHVPMTDDPALIASLLIDRSHHPSASQPLSSTA